MNRSLPTTRTGRLSQSKESPRDVGASGGRTPEENVHSHSSVVADSNAAAAHTPIQRGFPGHFIGWANCCFRLCHDVGDVRVSTVGCYHSGGKGQEPEEIGLRRKFETREPSGLPNGWTTRDLSDCGMTGYSRTDAICPGCATRLARARTHEQDSGR